MLQGIVGGVAGETVNVQNAYVGVTAAKEVRGEKVESLILLAGRVEGEVHTVVDTRGAIIAGLVGGLFAGLIVLVGRIAFRRDEDCHPLKVNPRRVALEKIFHRAMVTRATGERRSRS